MGGDGMDSGLVETIRRIDERRRELGIRPDQTATPADVLQGAQPSKKDISDKPVHDEHSKAKDLAWQLSNGAITGKEYKPHVRLPGTLVSTADFQQLSAKEYRLLIALHRHRNSKQGISRPGARTILKELHGLDIKEVPDYHRTAEYRDLCRQVVILKRKGYVLQLNRACKGRVPEYFLALNEEHIGAIKKFYSGGEGGANG